MNILHHFAHSIRLTLTQAARACAVLLLLAWLPAHSQTPLVAAGSVWKYLDTGVNLGTAWRATAFDDAAWASGPAQLGYGDGDESTVIGYGPSASAKYITSYFRKAFNVADPAALSALNLRVKRDDGIVLYLNGTEVYRNNMPSGSVTYTTLASTAAADDGATWQSATLPSTALLAGTNVLAAEIHQSARDSSDVSFDLELTALTAASSVFVTRAPYLQLATPTSIAIRWRTNVASDSRVWYGSAANGLTSSVSDATQTTEHVVTLGGLTPNTKYFYSVGSTSQGLAGGDAEHFFVTAPPSGTARATRIWVLGDAGNGTADQRRVRDAYYTFAGTTHTDLWLQLGDNAYDSGSDAEYQANVFNVYGAMLRKSVTWPTLGNHDTAQSTSPAADLPYFQMFSLPSAGQAGGVASGTKNYYAFDVGNIHFIALDSMASSRSAGSAMLNWLQSDLAANTKDWTVVYWHHAPYSRGAHDSDLDPESIEMRSNAAPILESFGVDLVLSGNSHNYQRSYLIDGHYGPSSTFAESMKKNGGSGRPLETGAYSKPLGSSSHSGTVYATVGSSGSVEGSAAVGHPAYFTTLFELGSMVIDVNGTRLDATFLNANGVVRDTFTITKGVAPNRAPSVALTAPSAGGSAVAPASIALAANASDSDGSVQRVEFYQGSTLLGTRSSAPYTFTWVGAPAGSYLFTAKAVDNLGAATTSSAVGYTVNAAPTAQPTTLIGKRSSWKYLDNGSNQGTAWRATAFSDAAWSTGTGEFGYGDGNEATLVKFGPNSTSKYITTYFRKTFNVANPAQFRSLLINLLRDDGAVVYLNGTELIRSNMPGGSISSGTLASTSIVGADESTFSAFTLGTAALLTGTNVLAVEVHQATVDSTDLSFDLELIAIP